ncbi:DNA-directed RNA polymerase subunit A' [Methanobrevibacter smithii]|uniref:DNA-directed RNA polymerase subunit A' n=1 Tax=Methanobrevibacter smithii TaxID=2173 RepID=UPI0037DC598B
MKGFIKKIKQINFGLMSPEDIREMSVVKIETPDTYDEDGYPIENGLMDPHLGVIDPSLKCRSCGYRGGECQGHFGSIELARPVIHVGFGDIIHKILRSTCNECGRVLLTDDEIFKYTEKIKDAQNHHENLTKLLKDIYNDARRDVCPHCEADQDDITIDKPVSIVQKMEGEDYKLTASEVRERLERISDEDAFVLGVNPEVARPEWLVLTVLPVPPVTVRPSITLDTGERSEDDLTHKLVDILRINQRLIENMEAGAPQLIVEDLWELLQYHVTTYFDNEASGVPPARHRSGRPLKTLAQRLKGKEGRFRSNLSGKRVNFSARTVISPDPNISINEVGVPEMIAKEVTVPAYVNDWNMDEMRTYIENGPNVHPGANYVIRTDGRKIRVYDETKDMILEKLEPGYIIERHLKDGDMVLFNRQPSLHRMSMMAHEVRVLPYKTFRLNLCVCPPYNADFDGDEMNMHVFQTDESRAEAKSLMRVQEHILSPRFGGPIIGAIHDHISGAYLLTKPGSEFSEEQALQIIRKSHLFNNENVDPKHLKRKHENWTGKELFSLLLPDDLNLVYKAEICQKCDVCKEEACDIDAYVVIENGELKHGVIDEKAYGSFSGRILDKIVKEYGPARAREFLDRSTDLAICGIMKTGITTSTNDEEIPEEAQERINEHLRESENKVDKLVEAYENDYLEALPGRSLEETLEMKIMQVLGEARDVSGQIAENYLTMEHNHSVVMARTGARASMLNLTQITSCVGQQSVRGGRIHRGYIDRTLPHFRKNELGAKAKGFVHSSYKKGLDPIEFFFHAMGGREGLVDTAIRTAQSGYMQRRLVNALQDLQVKPSGLVTDNQGMVIQLMFGEDGVDPAKSDFGRAADLNKIIDENRLGDANPNYDSGVEQEGK